METSKGVNVAQLHASQPSQGTALSPASSLSKESVHLKVADNDPSKPDLESDKIDLAMHEGDQYPEGIGLVVIALSILLCVFVMALDLTIIGTAIPRITDEFHSLTDVGWYGSAFFLSTAAFQPLWGKIFQFFDLKTMYFSAIFSFELGSLICGVARSSTMLIVGRAIAGVGGAGITSVYINLPIGGVAALAIFLSFRTPEAAKPKKATLKEKILQMDIPGVVIIIGAMTCYLLALQWGGTTKPWSSRDVIGTLIGFSFFASGIFFTLLYYLPIYFQTARGASAQQSGIDNIAFVLAAGLFSLLSGGLISKTGYYGPIMAVGSAIAAIGAGLIYTLEIDSSSGKWIGYQVLLGVGLGAIFQIPSMVGQSIARPSDIAAVSAIVLFFQILGGSIWISAAQAGFANRLVHAVGKYAPGVDPALVVATGATDLRKVFPPGQVEGVIRAYMEGLKTPFAVTVACACATSMLAFAPKWKKIEVKTRQTREIGFAVKSRRTENSLVDRARRRRTNKRKNTSQLHRGVKG